MIILRLYVVTVGKFVLEKELKVNVINIKTNIKLDTEPSFYSNQL